MRGTIHFVRILPVLVANQTGLMSLTSQIGIKTQNDSLFVLFILENDPTHS